MDQRGEQPNWEPALQRFFDYVKRNCALEVLHPGEADIAQETRPFMPMRLIKEYFTKQNHQEFWSVFSVLFPSGDHCHPREVLPKYTAVFCTLLQSGRGRYINHFKHYDSLNDSALPFDLRNPPANLPVTPGDPHFLRDICKEQWRFCTPDLEDPVSDKHFESERVLPIIFKKRIAGGGSANLWLIKVHPDYNKLIPRATKDRLDPQAANTFVLKEYSTNDAQRYYDNETAAFNKIGLNSSIIRYYGSFRRGNTFNVLLEYADQGTLKGFFERHNPPAEGEKMIRFWEGQFKLINALSVIHQVEPFTPGGPRIFQGWHQDVKPENILVISNGHKDPQDWVLKLADLGISHFKSKASTREDSTASDSYGTRTYGAPECSRPDEAIARSKLRVKQNIDIWSLGCVYSEAIRWLLDRHKGIRDYSMERISETKQNRTVAGTDCFHNGRTVLQVVQRFHDTAKGRLHKRDFVTPFVIEMVNTMLEVSEERPTAESLWRDQINILAAARNSLSGFPTSPSSRGSLAFDAQSPGPSQTWTTSSTAVTPPAVPPEKMPWIDMPEPVHGGFAAPSHDYNAPQMIMNHGGLALRYSPDEMTESRSRGSSQSQLPIATNVDNHASALRDDFSETFSTTGHPEWQRSGDPPISENRLEFMVMNPVAQQPLSSPRSASWMSGPSSAGVAPSASGGPRHSVQSGNRASQLGLPNGSHHGRLANNTQLKSPTDTADGQRDINTYSTPPARDELVSPAWAPGPRPQPTVVQNVEYMTLDQALTWKLDCKSTKSKAPGLNKGLLDRLKGRDHVFLVDDSTSMAAHWPIVTRVFEALSYIVKQVDDDGLDLFFTNSENSQKKVKKTKRLISVVRNQKQPQQTTTDINIQLSRILDRYKNGLDRTNWYSGKVNLPKPLSLYVLTDGVWENACTAIEPIRNTVLKLEDLRIATRQIGIQFISFGHSVVGLDRLRHLDNGLGLPKDIVDTEPSNGNVWKMLLGSINQNFDSQNEPSIASPTTPTLAANGSMVLGG